MNKLEALADAGCINPEWFLRDHIPRHAQHYGLDRETSFRQVLAEHRVLHGIQQANFRDMLSRGTVDRTLRILQGYDQLRYLGERLLGVQDAYYYRFTEDKETGEITQFDPTNPLSISAISDMDDFHKVSTMLGRPNKGRELVLFNDYTQTDYDVVVAGVERIKAAKLKGDLPHLSNDLLHIYIPATLDSEEFRYDPNKFKLYGPLEYDRLAA